jgi:hypothetical protein
MSTTYQPVRNLPVATFYYRGSHSHPVLRQVVVVENNKKQLTGYEIREGNIVRDIDDATVKTYLRSKIATRGQCRKESLVRNAAKKTQLAESTLTRSSMKSLK